MQVLVDIALLCFSFALVVVGVCQLALSRTVVNCQISTNHDTVRFPDFELQNGLPGSNYSYTAYGRGNLCAPSLTFFFPT